MYTPQQIQEIAFAKAVFGGYDVHAVDAVMEPLTNDYIALYNENNHLKNKLRALVKKLEELRLTEQVSPSADTTGREEAEALLSQTKETCARMLAEAEAEAAAIRKAAEAQIAALQTRSDDKIQQIQHQMQSWITALEQMKDGNFSADASAALAEPPKPVLTGKPSVDRPWMKFYPPGAEQMSIPPVTMYEYLKMMSRGEDLTVLHYYGTDISWKQFFRLVDKTARAMRAAGLGEGDQIPVMLQAVPEFLVILLAAERIGASLLCRDNTIPENAAAISKTSAKVMFAHDFITWAEVEAYTKAGIRRIITVNPWKGAVREAMPDHIVRSLESRYTEPIVSGEEICCWEDFLAAGKVYIGKVEAPVDLQRPLFRAYTSGSTGPSKQVIHSAQTMLGVVHQLSAYGSSDEFRPVALVTLLPPALIAVTVSMILMPMA